MLLSSCFLVTEWGYDKGYLLKPVSYKFSVKSYKQTQVITLLKILNNFKKSIIRNEILVPRV